MILLTVGGVNNLVFRPLVFYLVAETLSKPYAAKIGEFQGVLGAIVQKNSRGKFNIQGRM